MYTQIKIKRYYIKYTNIWNSNIIIVECNLYWEEQKRTWSRRCNTGKMHERRIAIAWKNARKSKKVHESRRNHAPKVSEVSEVWKKVWKVLEIWEVWEVWQVSWYFIIIFHKIIKIFSFEIQILIPQLNVNLSWINNVKMNWWVI